ncbi:hypothetical protein [Hymenobacter sp. YC55]|uniref:hypothetical protein n=1 Tax=Hymenobacter sp. YC55 TaxID=3034019 RepID=UPI0023F8A8DC|nr:hypothetical protein [Hymenobacter sp. YC55]MDF7814439.1 hypothetical protein [Hymenobacter sp. YC55]
MHQTSISGLTVLRALLLGLLVLIGTSPLVVAQTAPDTTRVRYSEETVTESDSSRTSALAQTYSSLTRLQIEEQVLWKIGLNNYATDNNFDTGRRYYRYGVYLIYERKLRDDISIMAELSPDFTRYRRVGGLAFRHGFSVRSQVAGRYYYNLNQRIRKGKNASNFSANYLSVAIGNGFGRRSHESTYYFYTFSKPLVRADLSAFYGLQRRLGQYGFVDFNFGFSTRLLPRVYDFSLSGSFRIGLALGR